MAFDLTPRAGWNTVNDGSFVESGKFRVNISHDPNEARPFGIWYKAVKAEGMWIRSKFKHFSTMQAAMIAAEAMA